MRDHFQRLTNPKTRATTTKTPNAAIVNGVQSIPVFPGLGTTAGSKPRLTRIMPVFSPLELRVGHKPTQVDEK